MKFLNKITLIGFTLNPEHTPGIKRIPIYDWCFTFCVF
jgi:hypothetical protein